MSNASFYLYRLLFGIVTLYGGLASVWKGDIQARFLEPTFYFSYSGSIWEQTPMAAWVYAAYSAWIWGALGILLGLFYRLSLVVFFVGFTYLHFLDAGNYINHYYLISLLALLLLFVPAHTDYSLDARWGWAPVPTPIPLAFLSAFRLQIAIVYICAGIAKLNTDWFFNALPIRIWLLQAQDFPVLGNLFLYRETAFFFSWIGAFYDLTIVFWLLWARTRVLAYGLVLVFHILTGLLFDIGLFPPMMIISTLLFFPPAYPSCWLSYFKKPIPIDVSLISPLPFYLKCGGLIYFLIQIIIPFRHLFLYTGNTVWTEEGYRFGWRVMLFEKEGNATFYVRDSVNNKEWMVENSDFLTPFQIKQMSTKPEHLRQFAHHLAAIYARRYAIKKPIVRADVFVTYNSRPSRRLIRGEVNLAAEPSSFGGYGWIMKNEE